MSKFRLVQRAGHFLQRVYREVKAYSARKHNFGSVVAMAAFKDGLIPPGKSTKYIDTIAAYVDAEMDGLIARYRNNQDDGLLPDPLKGKIPVWCCWWQGEKSMPELVRLCYERLKQVIPCERGEIKLITLDNYTDYVVFPEHIMRKFESGLITMTTMSDVLRFLLLEKYGGYWLDATVFFSGEIPEQYFSGNFYCQRMVNNTVYSSREACGSKWCGFSMAGPAHSIVFRYMNAAFSLWWKKYNDIIDYVLIDYLLLSGYRHIPEIRQIIDSVPDNNEDIFEMYKVLNEPYTDTLWRNLTKRNVMHKLTYKMDLRKRTEDGRLTVYGYLHEMVDQGLH